MGVPSRSGHLREHNWEALPHPHQESSSWSQMTEKPQRRSLNSGTFHVPLFILSISDPHPSLPSPAFDTVRLLCSMFHFGPPPPDSLPVGAAGAIPMGDGAPEGGFA